MKKAFLTTLVIITATVIFFQPTQSLALDAYQQIKEEYLQAVAVFQAARGDYLAAREKLRTVRTLALQKEVLEKAKDFLLKADQTAIKYLRLARKKVERAGGITEETRQASLAEIDNDISWLAQKQSEIQSAESRDELVSLGKQVKNHWQKVRADVKRISGQILGFKINAVLTKLEEVYQRLEKRSEKAKASGRDTSKLESWLVEAREKLDFAQQKYEAGKNKFQAISNLEEANLFFNQGVAFIKEANQYLREAHQTLKKIIQELRY